jgi:hypothetical protein
MKRKLMMFGILMAIMFGFAITAQAIPYGFERITTNSSQDIAAQLSVDVTSFSSTQVKFLFANAGPTASSITTIYFDDASLLSTPLIFDSPTSVDFATGATPANLPGGNSIVPAFVANAALSTQRVNPPPDTGVNPGENVAIVFTLLGGNDFEDVLDDLASGDLRIGIHVQSIPVIGSNETTSDSFINDGFKVPEPGTLLLLGAGLLGLWAIRRRK